MKNKKTAKDKRNEEKIKRLTELIQGNDRMLIVMQDYPDPDAIASAVGLRALVNYIGNVQCSIAHGGTIGRAENRALSRYLQLNLRPIETIEKSHFDLIAMVDAQPKTGNASLPEDEWPQLVIDHHPIRHTTRRCAFTDIRGKYGATSTIIYEYLTSAKVPIKTDLATALVYGIRSDTQDLGRETSQADINAFVALYPFANKRMLSRIEHAVLPDSYFQLFANALASAEIYDSAVVASVGDTENPDMIGEVADLLIRKENTDQVLCFGYFKEKVLFSLRFSIPDLNAGVVARKITGKKGTGGGHNGFAGGQINMRDVNSLKERKEIACWIVDRFKKATGVHLAPGYLLVSKNLPTYL